MASISFGPKLGLLNNATIGEAYYDELRPFLRGVDALVQAGVIGAASTPPGSPNNGDAYIIFGGSGLWAGKSNQIAVWSTQVTDTGNNTLNPDWDYYTPQAGWNVWLPAVGYVYFDGTGWVSPLSQTNEILISNPIGNTLVFQPAGTQFSITGLTSGTGSAALTISQDSLYLSGRTNFPAASTSLVANTVIGTDDTTNLGCQYTIDATNNNVTVTLPAVAGVSNGSASMYTFTRNDATPSGHTVTILPTNPDKISGASSVTLTNFQSVTVTNPAASPNGGFLGGWLVIAKV